MTPSPIERDEAVARELFRERLCSFDATSDDVVAAITAALLAARAEQAREDADLLWRYAMFNTARELRVTAHELSKQAKEIAP